jgi:endonuclease/exonuclease/phosphatase family metal-dependent hydrolase
MSETTVPGTCRANRFGQPRRLLNWQKIAVFCLSLWCGYAGGPVVASDSQPLVVRVLTYNIHHAEDVNGKLNLERIAEVIRESKADVVALQEVDRHVPRSGKVDQLAELAKVLGMHGIFGRNIDLDGGEYGNAVLSRWPISDWQNHLLPNVRSGEQRGVLEADIQLPGSRQLKLLATHFDHRADETERLQSAAFVNERQEERSRRNAAYTVILAGDINARPESETLQVLLERWQMTDATLAPTIPSAEPKHKIDYIFIERETATIRVLEAVVVDEPIASDHRPLLSVLEIN